MSYRLFAERVKKMYDDLADARVPPDDREAIVVAAIKAGILK